MKYLDKKARLFNIMCRLGVKYWHLPFGDTSLWSDADKELINKAIIAFDRLEKLSTPNACKE